jgi:hypothetical protein
MQEPCYSVSWEEVSSPDFGARAAWREAVAAIAEKAKVASQSNGSTAYQVVNGHCDCALHKQHGTK